MGKSQQAPSWRATATQRVDSKAVAAEIRGDEEIVDAERRSIAQSILGVLGGAFGGAVLAGCANEGSATQQLASGSTIAWVDTVLGAAPPSPRTGDLNSSSSALGGATIVIAKGCVTVGDGGGGVFYWSSAPGTDDGGTVIVPGGSVGSTGACWRRLVTGPLDVRWFGAQRDEDSTEAIQQAIDTASAAAGDGLTIVTLGGERYVVHTRASHGAVADVNAAVRVKNRVVLRDGQLTCSTATHGHAVVVLGHRVGTLSNMVRPAGVEDVRVTVTPTECGVVAFRMDTAVRSSWFRNCHAVLTQAFSDGVEVLQQVGFELICSAPGSAPAPTVVGVYQNLVENCTTFNGYCGFRLRTRADPTRAEALAYANTNANRVVNCFAYGCAFSAAIIGPGANDNYVEVRADTFDYADSRDLEIVVLDGASSNLVMVAEEAGEAMTRHTVQFKADSIYNIVRYLTEDGGTGGNYDDSAITAGPSPSASKNTVDFCTRLSELGGRATTINYYDIFHPIPAAAYQEVRYRWIAPARCVITQIQWRVDTAPTNSAVVHLYVIKNTEPFALGDRREITGALGTGVDTWDLDRTSSTVIDVKWLLEKGDYLTFAFDNTDSVPHYPTVTAVAKFIGNK